MECTGNAAFTECLAVNCFESKVQVHLCENVTIILGSLVVKTQGKCSYYMEGVSKSATFMTVTVPMIIITVVMFLL
jgi:hypothetical protein